MNKYICKYSVGVTDLTTKEIRNMYKYTVLET